ncbi:MAG TPA: trigger factor, partial [Firmicutes bacterium]|nr:trigger factor [Candidatus Fermentithermobacillaceae bacterium]
MKVTTERLEGSRVSLEVEAPKEVVDQALQKAYRKVVREVNVPGFRRGKAPRSILERYYGKEILYDEAIRQVLPEQYVEAVKQANIEPVDDPEFTDVYFREGEPFRFKAVVYVRPEVHLQDYSDIAVPFEAPTVSEEDIDKQLEILKERMAELRPLEEGTALKEGHYATCRVKGIEGGDVKVEFDNDLSYVEVGRDYSFIPGLGQALIDMKKGDVKEFSGKYPGKEGEEPKEARFQVEVKEVYEKLVPKDAEEVAKNLGKGSSQEVRDEIRKNL